MSSIDAPDRLPEVDNAYIRGLHTPMSAELTIEALSVSGQIPPLFEGRYLRMGPNPMHPRPARHHWFAGDGMVHGVAIRDGKALWYRNRWIRSAAVTRALGEPRTPGPRHVFDTVNTNVVPFAGKVLGVVEAGSTPVEIGATLETLRYTDFDGALGGSYSAHPHVDPVTGEMLAVCYDVSRGNRVRHVVLAPDGKVRRKVDIPVSHGPMMHDFAFTGRYVILFDLPVTFSLPSALLGYGFPYRWNRRHRPRIGLLPRDGGAGDIIWCPVDPCFVFHSVNAYDAPDGTIIVDVVVHDRMFSTHHAGPDSRFSGLERWAIDPAARTVTRDLIDPTAQEFPRIDERRLGLPYRFAYSMAMTGDFLGSGLFKHDMVTGERWFHDFGPQRHPCEFIFVPAHAQAGEDEGWLMGFVIDARRQTTELTILDARRLGATPQATVTIPHVVPPGFHGNWVADAGLEQGR